MKKYLNFSKRLIFSCHHKIISNINSTNLFSQTLISNRNCNNLQKKFIYWNLKINSSNKISTPLKSKKGTYIYYVKANNHYNLINSIRKTKNSKRHLLNSKINSNKFSRKSHFYKKNINSLIKTIKIPKNNSKSSKILFHKLLTINRISFLLIKRV